MPVETANIGVFDVKEAGDTYEAGGQGKKAAASSI